ncbi:MAG: hypothetical protein AAGD18_18820 [Actinomycetota bacterium]
MLVATTSDSAVINRRRIELIDAALPAAPIHHHGGAHTLHRDGVQLDDGELSELVGRVRASAASHAEAALDALSEDLGTRIATLSLREWPADFPTDIAVLRQTPWESQADSVMYRQVLADEAVKRGSVVAFFDAKTVQDTAVSLHGDSDVLIAPRAILGAPWNHDHRIAFAAAIVAASESE